MNDEPVIGADDAQKDGTESHAEPVIGGPADEPSPEDASEAELDRLQEAVDRHCPVLDDLRRPVPVTLRLRNRT